MSSHLPPTIMIVEPDTVVRTSLSNTLERNGFNVINVGSSDEALKMPEMLPIYSKPNVIVISTKLDALSGIELCTIFKTKNSTKLTPIIMISEKEDGVEKIQGLVNSIDDYIIKPFPHNELIRKVKSLLSKSKPDLKSKTLEFRNISMNLASYKVTKNGIEIHLGPTEFKILQCFIESPMRIFSREEIMNYVWQTRNNVEVRTIDVHINRLRAALKQPHENIPIIKTVRSAGYCLELPGSN